MVVAEGFGTASVKTRFPSNLPFHTLVGYRALHEYGLEVDTSLTYRLWVFTIVETPTFATDAKALWTEEERGRFVPGWHPIPALVMLSRIVVGAARYAGIGLVLARAVVCV